VNLADLQRHWNAFGRQDPYWAILTDPAKRGNRWTPEEFFETGRVEIAELMTDGARLGVPHQRRRALDFGCGAGRLTQALADHFDTVVGVDVAPSMIALARTHNRHRERCTYEVNDRPELSRWPNASFDLIYTSRVLQHIEPRYSAAYVREFVRLLAPGGYLSFDVPSASGDAAALADGSVPASAMRAHVQVSPHGPVDVGPAAVAAFTVTVTNLSSVTWHDGPGREINVGNHWLDAHGELVRQDDVRVKLPTPLAPGASATIDMRIVCPPAFGVHRLEFDVVQEGVAWFGTCGSEPAKVILRIVDSRENGLALEPPGLSERGTWNPEPQAPGPEPQADDLSPIMEMHAILRDEVESMLRQADALLLDVRRVHHCGPQWLAFRYDVSR
jgi:SAM-dependent methyltransferase